MARKHPGWLERGDGTRIRLDAGTFLVGRSDVCHLVLADRRASRVHALVRATPAGTELLVLSRNPVLVNDAEVRSHTWLSDGDRLGFPGEDLRVTVPASGDAQPTRWALELPGGSVLRPERTDMALGGGDDDLVLPGWPPAAARIRFVQGALLATFATPVLVDGAPAATREMRSLNSGTVISWQGVGVTVLSYTGNGLDQTTVASAVVHAPHAIRFEFLPTGARVELRFRDGVAELKLSELRARLLAALLAVRSGYRPGDWLADENLLSAIWPNQPGRGRADLNLLLHRLRSALASAGVNPFRLIERPKEGGSTRIVLAAWTEVQVI